MNSNAVKVFQGLSFCEGLQDLPRWKTFCPRSGAEAAPFSFLRATGAVSEPGLWLKLSWEVVGYQQSPGVEIVLHNNLFAWKEIADFKGVSRSMADEKRAARFMELLSNHNSHSLQHFCRSDPQGYLLYGKRQLWSTSVRHLGSNGPSHSLLASTNSDGHGSWSQTTSQNYF